MTSEGYLSNKMYFMSENLEYTINVLEYFQLSQYPHIKFAEVKQKEHLFYRCLLF